MNIISATAHFTRPISTDRIMAAIEEYGRTCYKSEEYITDESADSFVRRILKQGHESVIEHEKLTARIICDRGVSHELVRHRLASYSQESTRYCNYSKGKFGKELTFVRPCFWPHDSLPYHLWHSAMASAEGIYMHLLGSGATPEQARSILPNSLKTEVVMTANLREWRHFFRLRCAKAAHPQMREIALQLLIQANAALPVIFEDLADIFAQELGEES